MSSVLPGDTPYPRQWGARSFWLWLGCLWSLALPAQERFSRVYGGAGNEHAMSVIQAQDGAYVMAGFTTSDHPGRRTAWVMKVDTYGNEVWRRLMSKSGHGWAHDLIETRDGNYVIAGYVSDSATDVRHAWVFALNRHGELMWTHTYGGERTDEARALIQTQDGGFAVAGYSHSFARGKSDFWLLRLDAVGQERWQKNYGGPEIEKAYCLVETADEGFVLGGFQDYGGPNKADMLLVRVDRHGTGIWRRAVPSVNNAVIEALHLLPQGQVLATGWGHNPENQSLDACLVIFGSSGQVLSTQYIGGTAKDAAYDLIPAHGGGYIMAGQTASFSGTADAWIVKLDAALRPEWQRYSQGQAYDWAHTIAAAQDGGYVIAGGTNSYASSGSDVFFIKTDAQGDFGRGLIPVGLVTSSDPSPPDDYTTQDDPYKPNLYLLAIGVSHYQDTSIQLSYAHTDAAAIAETFAVAEGGLFGRVEARLLTNADATLHEIRQGIAWLGREAAPKDLVLLFISAHGQLDAEGSLYILPHDSHTQNLFATGLSIQHIHEGIGASAGKKLILLDACHSGQSAFDFLTPGRPAAQARGQAASRPAGSHLNEAITELMQAEAGLTVMTSSSGQELSFEHPNWGHGAFTKALLEGLTGAADHDGDRIIRLLELNLYITSRVRSLTQGRQHPYMPLNLFGDIPLMLLD